MDFYYIFGTRNPSGIVGHEIIKIKCLMIKPWCVFTLFRPKGEIFASWKVLGDKVENFIHLDHEMDKFWVVQLLESKKMN